ncbi:MAG TPA: hypothetical protein VGM44_04685 [Polyangiaceae bacterium]|jgi:hypothetical protein
MFLSKYFHAAGFASLVAVAACLPACSSNKDSSASTSNPISDGIARDGMTTTAALNELLGTPPTEWGWAGGAFQTPTDQAVLPASAPYTFTWQADMTSEPNAGDVLDPNKQQGQVFLLVFDTPGTAATASHLLRVFTNLDSYTPDPTAWQTLVGAGDMITLSITTATFENDQLPADGDGGPFAGTSIHFTVQ